MKRTIKIKTKTAYSFIKIRMYLCSKYKLLESSYNQSKKLSTFLINY